MEKVENVRFESIGESLYFRTTRMVFDQGGRRRYWDILADVHDSVSVLLFDVDREKFVFVRQFRPPVYVSRVVRIAKVADERQVTDWSEYPMEIGVTTELCAGIADKDKPMEQLAKEEVLEECGYRLPTTGHLQFVTSCLRGVGLASAIDSLFYAEVDDSMVDEKFGGGNAHEQESIEVVYCDIEEAREMAYDPDGLRPAGFVMAIQWFIAHRADKFKKGKWDDELYT